tara:strand:- start:5 stop:310 length:306 start_codon:yes stop_codon:yes gene_type:complete
MAYKQKKWSPFTYEGIVRSKRVPKTPKFINRYVNKVIDEPQSQQGKGQIGLFRGKKLYGTGNAYPVTPQSEGGTGKHGPTFEDKYKPRKEYIPQSQRKKKK